MRDADGEEIEGSASRTPRTGRRRPLPPDGVGAGSDEDPAPSMSEALSFDQVRVESKNAVQSALAPSPVPAMNCSTISRPISSVNCTGGDFMK